MSFYSLSPADERCGILDALGRGIVPRCHQTIALGLYAQGICHRTCQELMLIVVRILMIYIRLSRNKGNKASLLNYSSDFQKSSYKSQLRGRLSKINCKRQAIIYRNQDSQYMDNGSLILSTVYGLKTHIGFDAYQALQVVHTNLDLVGALIQWEKYKKGNQSKKELRR